MSKLTFYRSTPTGFYTFNFFPAFEQCSCYTLARIAELSKQPTVASTVLNSNTFSSTTIISQLHLPSLQPPTNYCSKAAMHGQPFQGHDYLLLQTACQRRINIFANRFSVSGAAYFQLFRNCQPCHVRPALLY